MPYSYYPGCSLHSTGVAYDVSVRAAFRALGEELIELEDWNCCGATIYMSVKETVAMAISARNLALAEKLGYDLVVPCSACFTVLNKTRRFMEEMPELRAQVDEALAVADLHPEYTVRVRHPLEVLINDFGIDRLAELQKFNLSEFHPACYYGCQILRPERAMEDDPEVPMTMERLLAVLGARPVNMQEKTRCCGGMLNITFTEVSLDLNADILSNALDAGANTVVTVCPLCQYNLEAYQGKMKDLLHPTNGEKHRLPVLYFSQLVGLALGCSPEQVGMHHQIIPVPRDVMTLAEV